MTTAWLRPLAPLALLLLMAGAAQSDAIYEVAPVLTNGQLTALAVELHLRGGASGEEVLDLPLDSASGHPHLADLSVEGAEVSDSGTDKLRLRFRPGAELAIRYRLLPGSDKDPEGQSRAPVIRPEWFAVHGQSALVVPEGHDHERASLRYVSPPQDWTLTSNLSERSTTLGDVRETMLLGGMHYQEISRQVLGAPLRLAYPPQFATVAAQALDDIAQVDTAERGFWRATGEPFFVAIVPLADDVEYQGRGLNGGFALFLGDHVPKDAWLHLLAHEHMHTWISRRIGGFPETDSDSEAWLNEGFTEAFTARVLLQTGLWSMDQFVADQNAALLRYGTSPVKAAPNSRINADRNREWDVNKLPYDRGRLLALLWDKAFRRQTSGRVGLEDVMRAQEQQAVRDGRKGVNVSADLLFPDVARRLTGVDLSGDIARYVDRGEPIELPRDLFGPCAAVVKVNQAIFDRGFDLEATQKAHGRVTGLEPGGPAERAGLRTGDKISVDEVPSHDSQTTLSYPVSEAGGGRHVVRYKPEGAGQVTFQQVQLKPVGGSDRAKCARSLSRP